MQHSGTQLPKHAYDYMTARVAVSVRPNRVATWAGEFTPVMSVKPIPPWKEEKRRSDIAQSYGSKTPTRNSSRTIKNTTDIGVGRKGQTEAIMTPEGYVNLPTGRRESSLFMPSVSAVEEALTAPNTRRLSYPVRFYR